MITSDKILNNGVKYPSEYNNFSIKIKESKEISIIRIKTSDEKYHSRWIDMAIQNEILQDEKILLKVIKSFCDDFYILENLK